MAVSLDDQLQSIGGDLVGVRAALDALAAEEIITRKEIDAAQLLAMAQSMIDQARAMLKE